MRTMPDADTLRTQARRVVERTSSSAGIRIDPLRELGELRALAGLFSAVWGAENMISTELLRALAHADNCVTGAFAGGDLVGGAVGFLGMHDGELILHSHIVGVSPAAQGRNVGFVLKQHQRCWALDRGITEMHWTYDPLVRRNAYFNVTKIAARAAAYYPTFYGVMQDGVNAGDESDRMLVVWDLVSPAAVDASERRGAQADAAQLLEDGAALALVDREGVPELTGETGETLLCATPANIIELRERDLPSALRWRKALRATLGAAMDDGYLVTGFSRDGHYVLSRP